MYASCSSSSSSFNRSRKYFCFTSSSAWDASRCFMRVSISRESGPCGRWFQRTGLAEVDFFLSEDFNDLSGCVGETLTESHAGYGATEPRGATKLWSDYCRAYASLARFSSRSLSACYFGQVLRDRETAPIPGVLRILFCPVMAPDKRNAFVPRYRGQLLGFQYTGDG